MYRIPPNLPTWHDTSSQFLSFLKEWKYETLSQHYFTSFWTLIQIQLLQPLAAKLNPIVNYILGIIMSCAQRSIVFGYIFLTGDMYFYGKCGGSITTSLFELVEDSWRFGVSAYLIIWSRKHLRMPGVASAHSIITASHSTQLFGSVSLGPACSSCPHIFTVVMIKRRFNCCPLVGIDRKKRDGQLDWYFYPQIL